MDYEYRCTECEHVFTVRYRFSENPSTVHCPECGGLASRFFGTVPSICFKGSGWASKSELEAMDPKNDSPLDLGDPRDPGDIPV